MGNLVLEGHNNFTYGQKTMHSLKSWSYYLIEKIWTKNESDSELTIVSIKEYKFQIGQIMNNLHMKINNTNENDMKNELNIILEQIYLKNKIRYNS